MTKSFSAHLRGTRYYSEEAKAIVLDLKVGDDSLTLVREPENQYDENAIKVMKGDIQLGHVAKEVAAELAPLMDAGMEFRNEVFGYYNPMTPVLFIEPVEDVAA